ncbi:MAG: putative toxin-antitoxin system toxin component, PIN family [Longimicrobiaceae bacterium]
MRIVLDTNVLVSALLNPHGTPGRIIDLVLSGAVVVLFDDRILAEYRDVLARPKLRIAPVESAYLLEFIETEGVLAPAPPLDIALPDPDDLPFVEVAAASFTDALVTGNARHFAAAVETLSIPIVSPAEFIDLWHMRDT